MLEAFRARGKGLGHLDFGNKPVNTNDAERGANKLHLGSESCGMPGPGPKEGVLSALSCASLREGRQGNRTCSTYPFEGGSSLFSARGGVAAH